MKKGGGGDGGGVGGWVHAHDYYGMSVLSGGGRGRGSEVREGRAWGGVSIMVWPRPVFVRGGSPTSLLPVHTGFVYVRAQTMMRIRETVSVFRCRE